MLFRSLIRDFSKGREKGDGGVLVGQGVGRLRGSRVGIVCREGGMTRKAKTKGGGGASMREVWSSK